MDFWRDFLSNRVLICALTGWLAAQILKTLLDIAMSRSFTAERLVGSGGMPSSHSATVCALVTATAYQYGPASFEFAISFVLAAVVMYDAIGVRQETGKQAKLLNIILEKNVLRLEPEEFGARLKELVGHTPLQVMAGAILGILIAIAMNHA